MSDKPIRAKMSKDKIIMPKELTAENGAKALLMGEFKETIWVDCPHCFGEGCEECSHHGGQWVNVLVGWTTIKDIYALAAKHLGVEIKDDY